MAAPTARRLRRLADELDEVGLELDQGSPHDELLLVEIDHALRPEVHERRTVASGSVVEPASDPGVWGSATQLDILHQPIGELPLDAARRFADGRSSWIVRRLGGADEWMIFDRPASSERDLVVLATALDATIVQRHRSGFVRVVGGCGVLRWAGLRWHHEPPVARWIDAMSACGERGDDSVLAALLDFAVHDLGALGIGSLLIYRPDGDDGPTVERRLPAPPPLDIRVATHLAPLRHSLSQVDGAAVFDAAGVLRQLGVRLVPSAEAENTVDAFRGTRHTSGRRYSFDDPRATVIAVSEDGPVSVLRNGKVLGRSPVDQ